MSPHTVPEAWARVWSGAAGSRKRNLRPRATEPRNTRSTTQRKEARCLVKSESIADRKLCFLSNFIPPWTAE